MEDIGLPIYHLGYIDALVRHHTGPETERRRIQPLGQMLYDRFFRGTYIVSSVRVLMLTVSNAHDDPKGLAPSSQAGLQLVVSSETWKNGFHYYKPNACTITVESSQRWQVS